MPPEDPAASWQSLRESSAKTLTSSWMLAWRWRATLRSVGVIVSSVPACVCESVCAHPDGVFVFLFFFQKKDDQVQVIGSLKNISMASSKLLLAAKSLSVDPAAANAKNLLAAAARYHIIEVGKRFSRIADRFLRWCFSPPFFVSGR